MRKEVRECVAEMEWLLNVSYLNLSLSFKAQVPAVNLKMTNKAGQNLADSFSEGMFRLS